MNVVFQAQGRDAERPNGDTDRKKKAKNSTVKLKPGGESE